ncbi:oxidoreductase [Gyrodon lividus]|nr:oxidoreductase [Gyrodon lividus]
MFFGIGKKKWDPKGKHIYITGGSQGLGLAFAKILAKKGANISIVARTQSKLDEALKELETLRTSPTQSFQAFSYSLASPSSSAAALAAATAGHAEFPDAVFCCAGASHPMFFVEMGEGDIQEGMMDGYWVQAWTAWSAAKEMAKRGKKGKIVFVSSTLGLMSFVGWASYSPAKHALRGLAETLRSELLLYGISTHIFFPATMFTPGFDEENKTKPSIMRKIESTDEGITAEKAAEGLFKGVERGDFHITVDLITSVFKASTRGNAPRGNWVMDILLDIVSFIAIPIWRRSVDNQVLAHREEHTAYLQTKGFFGIPSTTSIPELRERK